MAVTIKETSQTLTVGASVSFALNVAPEAGDWLVVVTVGEAAGSAHPIPPAGWTAIRNHGGMNAASTGSMGVYAKLFSSALDLNWTSGANTNVTRVKTIVGAGGMDVQNWKLGDFVPRATNATTTTAVAPVVTATEPGMALVLAAERTVAAETSAQVTVTGATKFAEDLTTASTIMVFANKAAKAGDVIGPVTFTFPNTHANNAIAGTIIIPEIPAVAETNSGMPVRISTTSGLQTAALKIATDSGLVTPKGVKAVSPGFGSVQAMLDTPQFKIAHRGGSVDFPEMSLYAYGQSALLGYNALEVSLGRSSDGVIFGLHDETFQRTSGVDLNPAAMTWAEIQKLQIFSSQPYMRFEEVLDIYPNHVIFADSKYIPYNVLGEVLDIMDSKGGPKRFVYKYYGATRHATLPRSRGYKAWGYFYEVNVPTLPEWQGDWDILGMEYTGTQAAWDAITSYGKPVIGHICPSLAATTTALSKGATGLMVSGVKSVAAG